MMVLKWGRVAVVRYNVSSDLHRSAIYTVGLAFSIKGLFGSENVCRHVYLLLTLHTFS